MNAVARGIPFLAWLVVVWVALWGELTVANVLGGVLVGSALIVLFPAAVPHPPAHIRPWRTAVFLAYFFYKLVEANLVVAWEVITPNNERVREAVVAVPMSSSSDAIITLVANAITLTPGTLTIEVRRDPAMLFVHVLHLRSIERARLEVQYLEYLALRAFADDDTARSVERPRIDAVASDATRSRLRDPDGRDRSGREAGEER